METVKEQKSLFLEAFDGTNTMVPVWFMRQAGRYLPEYQAIKAKHVLNEMFRNPQLAAEITCMPMDILNVDAAILFADILTLPSAMGIDIVFDNKKGPIVNTHESLKNLHDFESCDHVQKTIKLVKERLNPSTPLIGFAGSPFTVLTYLIEGGSSIMFKKTLKTMAESPEIIHQAMEKLTGNTIRYLNHQKDSGIDVFQLFDSWAGILRPADYAHFVLPYVKKIFNEVDLPSIYFLKNTNHLLSLMDQTSADFLSVDHTVVLGHNNTLGKTNKGIQGNLYNGLLYADNESLEKEVVDVLMGAQKHNRFIFNLSHGVFPDVEVDKLKYVVEKVHSFPWKSNT